MSEKVSYKTKLHEPILNPLQVVWLLLFVLFEVISNIIPILMGLDVNPIYVVVMLIIGIVSYGALAMLRAAYPESVPDTRITAAFTVFIKQIIDALITNKDEHSDLQSLLERIIVWAVREWDVLYEMDLADAIEYAKTKLKKEVDVPIATIIATSTSIGAIDMNTTSDI